MKGLDPYATTNSLYGNFYGKYAYPMTSYTPDFLHSEMERSFYDKTKQMQQTYFDRYASLRLPNQQMNKQYFVENNNDNNQAYNNSNDNNQNLFRQQQKMQPTQFENYDNNNFNINYKSNRPVSAFPQTQRNMNNYYDNNLNNNNLNQNNNNWEKGEVPSYSQIRNKIQTRKKEYYNNSYRKENPQEFINKNEVEPNLHYRVENTYKLPPSVKHLPYGYIPNQEMFQEFKTKRPQSSNKPRINVYREAFEKNKNYQEQFNSNNNRNMDNNIQVRPPSAQFNNNKNNLNQQQFMNRPQVRIPTPKNDYNNNNNVNNVNNNVNNNNYRVATPQNNYNNNVQMYNNPNNLSVNDVYNNIMNPPKQDLCPTYKSYNGPNYHLTNSNYYNQNSVQQPSYDPQQMNQYNQQIQQPPIEPPQYNNDNFNYSNNDNNLNTNENNIYNNTNNNNYDNINNNNYENNVQENYNNPPPKSDYQNSIERINQITNNNPPKKTQNAYEFLTKVVNSKVGLSNISNITYMTSCLQNLIHCPLFVSKFLEEGIPIFKSKSRDTPVAGCLYNLMVDITKSNDFTSISPNIIKNCIQDIHNEFQDNNNEHDCQEFCRYLIQDINTDLNRITPENKTNINNENYEGEANKRFEYEVFIKENLSKENSIITDLFFGYLSFEFTCMNCGGKEFSFSQFLDLPLQFESNKNIHLNTLLRKNILKKEIVEMEEKCSLCHKSNEKEQIIKIAKLPNVLILSLQRNDFENNIKNESVVQFDEIMDLSELIDNDLIYEENINRFKLFGVIYLVNGKYVSFCFVEDGWFKFKDDEVVKENPELNSKDVYSLFYMKI